MERPNKRAATPLSPEGSTLWGSGAPKTRPTPPSSATKRKASDSFTSTSEFTLDASSPPSSAEQSSPLHFRPTVDPPYYDTKETFRVREIPESFNEATFRRSLSISLGFEQDEVQVWSFSYQPLKPSCRTATVTFSKKPPFFIDRGRLRNPSTRGPAKKVAHEEAKSCFVHLAYVDPTSQVKYVQRVRIDQDFSKFTSLSPIENEPSSKIDCIILHGFGGHAIGSFRSPNSPFTWIRDRLPKDLPELNVLTYGYDSSFNDESSVADIFEWSQAFKLALCSLRSSRADEYTSQPRPIIFIVHSLGGIILKEAIIALAKSKIREDNLILMSIYGALFFGVPSKGMDVQHLAAMASNNPTQHTVSLLDREVGSRFRQRQHDDFCHAFPYSDSKIMQWFELRKTRTPDGNIVLLVDSVSSTAGRQWECGEDYVFSLDADHRHMVKFVEMDPSYDDVLFIIRDRFLPGACSIIEKRFAESDMLGRRHEDATQDTAPARPQLEPSDSSTVKFPCVMPPYQGKAIIQYRDGIVLKMKLHIQNRRIKEPTFTLHGEGGVGKTQTVLKYIAEQQEHHKHILWANADSRDKLSSDFDHLAAKLIPARKISLSPEANREAVKLWLQNNDDWLLVFDNADKPDVLKEFWPFRAGRGCIIVTSRDSSVSNLAVPTDGVQVAEVGCLRDDDGAELLMSRLPEQMRDLEASRKISHRLGGLPLAIAHIASYINNDLVTTLSEFLDDYDKIEESVVEEHGAGYATLGYQRSLSTAWKMSLDALSSPARKFIDAVALLDPTEIPVNLLLPTMTLADRRTISELIKSSLVHKNTAPLNRDGGSLIIHRLVQDACRRPWSPKRWQVVFDQAVSHVSDVFPKQINGASMIPFYPDCKKYDSHVLSLGQHFESSLATPHPLKGSLQFAEMLAHCGWFHYERMQFQTATFVLRMAADILSDAEGRERELVLALVLNNLHLIDVQYSRLDAGEKLIRRAVELREKWLRSSDFAIQELGNSYSNYANILRKRSLVTETEQLFLKALEIRENGAGATDELLHHTLYNYGSWMLEMGRVDEARAFLSRALNLPNQETTSIYGYTVYCVARLEYMTGNITESLEIHKRCLKWRIETEGWEHLLTGVSLHKVGSMQLDLGNEAEGIANLTKALHAFRQSKGDKGLLPRTLLKLGRTIRSRAIRTNSYEGMIEGGTMVDEGSELAKSYRGPNVSLESEDDLNNLVKSTYR